MEPVHITRGNVCMARYGSEGYPGDWHRCKILRVLDDNRTKLLYLDFGTIGYAPSDQLKYMTPDYAILPLQCLYVTLYRVLPIDVDPSTGLPLWNGKGLDRLLTKYENIKVTATVFKYDPKEPRICTWITAVDSDGKIVELNKEFCDWGYGVLDLRSIPLATQLTEDIPIPGTSVNSEPDFDELLERILSRSSTSQPRPPSPDDENNPNSVKNLKEPPAPKKIIFSESEGEEEEGEKTKPCGMVRNI
ncbi:tudor and KH domain-containing protein-like [Diaphorina citri]|uniref:Tudor and KH domain-containing protein-like n=1 Tax=Diaphorina citri TaxID=121845 RepID=A0A3Q0IJF9_DIACI|nr:tudor and KH domain-containing protein-like [Diaphorina citri]